MRQITPTHGNIAAILMLAGAGPGVQAGRAEQQTRRPNTLKSSDHFLHVSRTHPFDS
jgi:hypothetical protein